MGVSEKKILWIRLFLGIFANQVTVKNHPSDVSQASSSQVHSPRSVFGKTETILKDPFPNALNGVSRLPHWHRQSLSAYPTKIKEQSNRVLRYRGHSLVGKTRSGFFVREPQAKCRNQMTGSGTMLSQMRSAKETQNRFKMQKEGRPV